MPNDKITAVGANIAEKAAMIWNVADMLRGPFKPHEYGLVILPMTVVKRFHDCLLPTHQAVLDTYEKVKKLQVIDGFLQKASGYQFYNTSRFTFETLLADPDNFSLFVHHAARRGAEVRRKELGCGCRERYDKEDQSFHNILFCILFVSAKICNNIYTVQSIVLKISENFRYLCIWMSAAVAGCSPGVKIPPPGCGPNFYVTFFRGPAFSPPGNGCREHFVENSPTGGVGIPGNNS